MSHNTILLLTSDRLPQRAKRESSAEIAPEDSEQLSHIPAHNTGQHHISANSHGQLVPHSFKTGSESRNIDTETQQK